MMIVTYKHAKAINVISLISNAHRLLWNNFLWGSLGGAIALKRLDAGEPDLMNLSVKKTQCFMLFWMSIECCYETGKFMLFEYHDY